MVLGPLLFNRCSRQLVIFLHSSKIHLYADDTQIYNSFALNNMIEAIFEINEDVTRFARVAKDYCFLINPEKLQVMFFGPKKHRDIIPENLNINLDHVEI